MAITVTHTGNSVFGNLRVRFIRVTATDGFGAFASGLNSIDSIALLPQSLTTGSIKLNMNVLSNGTASPGFVSVTGITSGDVFRLTVFGQ